MQDVKQKLNIPQSFTVPASDFNPFDHWDDDAKVNLF